VILPRFQFKEPRTLVEALEIVKQNKGKVAFIAGGTDLLVNLKKKVVNYEVIISLEGITDLTVMEYSDRDGLTLGAMTRVSDLEDSLMVKEKYPALAIAAGGLGSQQVRNRATVGGNICTARPAGDMIGPLIAYDAVVRLVSNNGERFQRLEELFLGPGKTIIKEDEILVDIRLNAVTAKTGASYIKYTLRKAMEIAMVNVTTVLAFQKGLCESARVVLGAVAPTYIRGIQAEEALVGEPFSEENTAQAAILAAGCCQPISDKRASADYRRDLVEVLTRRSIREAASRCLNL
jgi:CO/xanthine dehydrogenase FAD-binding subunit